MIVYHICTYCNSIYENSSTKNKCKHHYVAVDYDLDDLEINVDNLSKVVWLTEKSEYIRIIDLKYKHAVNILKKFQYLNPNMEKLINLHIRNLNIKDILS